MCTDRLRRNGVTVYSSRVESQLNTGHLCGSATRSSRDVTWIACDDTARYITLYQHTNNHPNYWQESDTAMNFCEVQVFVCDAGTFGNGCNTFCHCRDGPCNYATGKCTGGCKPNWSGETCSVCDSKHYGPLCEKSCSSRHCDESRGKSSCDEQTGTCDNGCTAGWVGKDCLKVCVSDHYGSLCDKSCSSRHCNKSNGNSCDKLTGKCDNGCTPGWMEEDCTKKCSEFTYGLQCANNCSQRMCLGNSECDHVTGKCYQGCDRGYQGEDCTTICLPGRYGYNCNTSCEKRGCAAKSACDRFNGTCERGCLKGWELPDCITECRQNTFGPSCLFNCTERHCKGDNSSCDVQDGVCQDGCQPGWTNANCTEKCDESSYGSGCVYKCNKRHCQNTSASCNRLDGSCGGECENKYRGTDCTECDVGQYGPECNSSCSARHCEANDESCDHVTGLCSGPCEAGWQGDDCTLSIAQTDLTDENPGPIIGGVIGTAVVVVVVVVIIIFVFLRRTKQAKDDTKAGEPIVPENKPSTKEGKHYAPDVSIYVNVELSSTNSAKRFEVNETFASDVVPAVNTGDVALVVDQEESEVQQPDEDEEDIQDPNTYYNDVQPAAPSFSLPEEGFDVTELEAIIECIRNQPGGFQAEYVKLPSGFSHPYNDSQIPENRCKNRYAGYYPYDNNRVKLSTLPNTPHSDYINASYVDAYEKPNFFIALKVRI
ncbi:multiple epidermal growth factor-like domains protein 10 [Gigantopelta aegis]|uniref:multiple epidermal growth factor-like domains protein 10 n=1 Tax=Gigantopelta aegis TaxID=1735272 RepID=UPI001B888E13|nr:multiple epidermal growth factor-like domains protein 10 [Gigantopelta aegis]